MRHLPKLSILLSVLLALGVSSALYAQPQIETINDSSGVTAQGYSSDEIVSMSIRVVGPDGFAFEDRVEDSVIGWIPEGELSDGIYTWEARMVTVESGAPPRQDPILYPSEETVTIQEDSDSVSARHDSAESKPRDEVPLARFFDEQYKSVTTESGMFRVREGFIEPIHSEETASYQHEPALDPHQVDDEPGIIGSITGAVLDFFFPSAHAANCSHPCVVDSTGTLSEITLTPETDEASPNSLEIEFFEASNLLLIAPEGTGSGSEPFRLDAGAPAQSLSIEGTGDIGLGTSAPDSDLHISDASPVIHLEDTSDVQSWYVKNTNAGRFEIGEVRAGDPNPNPFTIEPGAPDAAFYIRDNGFIGLGTDNPSRPLEIIHGSGTCPIRLDNSSNRWQICNFNDEFQLFNATNSTRPLKIANAAPDSSLVMGADGNIGLGTGSPSAALHVRRNDNTAQVRVTDSGSSNQTMFSLQNNGFPIFDMEDTSQTDVKWEFAVAGTEGSNERFQVSKVGSGQLEFRLNADGSAEFAGDVTANGVLLTSTREAKTDFEPLDESDILNKVASLEISEWRYKTEPDTTRHIGPIAEEFHDVFGLSDGKTLNMIDTNGIAFAAIQALKKENEDLKERLNRIEATLNH